MRGDRNAEREHQNKIPDGLHCEPGSGPPDECGAVSGFRTGLLPRRMASAELMTINAATATNSRNAKEPTRGDQPAKPLWRWAFAVRHHATVSAPVCRIH